MITSEPVTVPSVAAPSLGRALIDLGRLAKPRITLIVIATCAAGMAIAPVRIPGLVALLTLLGTTLIVASANVLNMWWERETDGLMERTRQRPLPAGRLSPDVALVFGLALGASSVPMLVAVNTLTATLGVVALGTYVLLYTPLKRHTCLALLIGAIPGAMPPLMGWTAATGTLLSSSVSGGSSGGPFGASSGLASGAASSALGAAGMGGVLLFLLLFVWQLPHFIAIAYFRAEDYARAGLKVVPVERGERAAKGQIAFYAVLLVGVSFAIAAARMAGTAYLLASVALGAIFLALAGYGFRAESGRGWAKSVFAYSVVYLTVLLGILVVDRAGV